MESSEKFHPITEHYFQWLFQECFQQIYDCKTIEQITGLVSRYSVFKHILQSTELNCLDIADQHFSEDRIEHIKHLLIAGITSKVMQKVPNPKNQVLPDILL